MRYSARTGRPPSTPTSELQDARLSPREQEVLSLYASGETAVSVAQRTGLSRETVADYVTRIRKKYAEAGRPAHSRVDLYRRAIEDGLSGGSRVSARNADLHRAQERDPTGALYMATGIGALVFGVLLLPKIRRSGRSSDRA